MADSNTKRKYGLDWPAAMDDIFIDLTLAKKWREEPYCHHWPKQDPGACMLRAARALFTPDQFSISKWTEEHAHDFTTKNFVITWGCAASSKSLRMDATVMTPTGPRMMGDLAVGDRVLAQDGKTAAIIRTHDVGLQEEYKLTFRDGTSTICAPDHLWEIRDRRTSGESGGWSRAHVIPTDKLAELCAGRSLRYSIPLCEPVYFKYSPSLIDPYVLGCLLGDGSLGGTSGKETLSFTNADTDILAELARRLLPGYVLKHRARTVGYGISSAEHSAEGPGSNYYINALRRYSLWGSLSNTKFVPKSYLYNSETVRRDILAGLLDTDGCVDRGGAVDYSTTSEQLAKDVQFLVQSLGGMAGVRKHKAGYKDKNGLYVPCKDVYLVRITISNPGLLFKCARKIARTKPGLLGSARRYIASVEKTGASSHMKCITIDHPRGLYLTNDFIVTHNSNDYGCMLTLDWIVDPYETRSVLASTSKELLKSRSYESVLRYFKILKKHPKFVIPGRVSKTTTAILNVDAEGESGDDEMTATEKASIRGVAVQQGTVEEARANIQGAHLPYVRLVLDELSQMREAAMEARTNLSIGCKDFRLFGLCNPDSINDLAGRYSVPINGWRNVDENTGFWETQWGWVRHHNGFKSPAITESGGKALYPYLINQDNIDKILKEHNGNTDAPAVWTMVKGWPPPTGNAATVLTEGAIKTFNMQDAPVWGGDGVVLLAGLDPAFTSEGDDCILQIGRLGKDLRGTPTIGFGDTYSLFINASDPRPVSYQIWDQVKALQEELGFLIENLGVDDSGTQSVADIIDAQSGQRCFRVNFGEKASGLPISTMNSKQACEWYQNRITEYYYALVEYGRYGQIRGLPSEAAHEFCQRRLVEAKRPRRLESKKDLKKRIKRSPDHADACACLVGVARERLGLVPGATIWTPAGPIMPKGPECFPADLVRMYDIDAHATYQPEYRIDS